MTLNSTAPQLTGTEKQIAWATDIRTRLLTEIDACLANIRDGIAAHPEHAAKVQPQLDIAEATITTAVADHTQAAWWIEHRELTGLLIVDQARSGNIR